MMRYVVASGQIMLLFVVVVISGCGDDMDGTPAQFVTAVNDTELWEVYFDKPPEDVSVSGAKEYGLSGTTLRIVGESCKTDIVVGWVGGQKTFEYDCPASQIRRGDPIKITVGGSNPVNEGPPRATRVTVEPPPNTEVPPDQEFTLTLDQGVAAVTVNGTAAQGSGLNWTAKPALAEGNAELNIEWTNRDSTTGSQKVGPYTVRGE